MIRHYLLSGDDIDLIRTRRRAENLLGVAVHICLLRYPGFGWSDGIMPPAELIAWLAEQLQVEASALDDYAIRRNTRHEHHALAMRHLGVSPFGPEHVQQAEDIATRAAFATDHGVKIVETLVAELRKQHLVLPSVDTLERLALKGRARARREAAAALFDALSPDQRVQLQALLVNDPSVGQTRLTWLRGYPHSASPANMTALLDRLKYLRSLNLPPNLGHGLHPDRLLKFAREGAVAPVSLLNDFGERRQIATVAAQMADLSITLALFFQQLEALFEGLYLRHPLRRAPHFESAAFSFGHFEIQGDNFVESGIVTVVFLSHRQVSPSAPHLQRQISLFQGNLMRVSCHPRRFGSPHLFASVM